MSLITAKNLRLIIDDSFDGVNARAERALGLGMNTMSRYLGLKTDPSKIPYTPNEKTLEKIVSLGYSLEWFLFDIGPVKRVDTVVPREIPIPANAEHPPVVVYVDTFERDRPIYERLETVESEIEALKAAFGKITKLN